MWRTRQPDRFVIGANLPWIGYGTDIGRSAWFPDGGLSRRTEALDRLDRALAAVARDGIQIVRTFLLCDARSGVRFDDQGVPLGIDESVLPDIDALLASARRHRVGIMPVLLDFHLCHTPRVVDRVQIGGHSRLIADEDARTAFVDRIVRPIVEHCATDDVVIAWDVFNEPEWCLRGHSRAKRRVVSFDALRRFLAEIVECVHQTARQPVTLGCAGTWQLDLVRGLDLDFYQVHWYDRFGWSALARPIAELGLPDGPVILGEFSGRTAQPADVLDAAKQAGYEGALVWSVLADDEQSAYPVALREWVRRT